MMAQRNGTYVTNQLQLYEEIVNNFLALENAVK